MDEDRMYEIEKMAVSAAAGVLGVLVIINLILDLFGRWYL